MKTFLLVITIIACALAQPIPPTGIPLTFYSIVTFTYTNYSYYYPPRMTYVKVQEIASDFENKKICRWNQKQLKPMANYSTVREFCNYGGQFGKNIRFHYDLENCYGTPAVPPEFPMLKFPREIATANYLGKEPVGEVECDHWNKVLFINIRINIDIYAIGNQPCKISVNYLAVKEMSWIFDNFSTQIPPKAFDNCGKCKVSKTCKANPNATMVLLQNALNGACGYIDCSEISAGGDFENYTFFEKVDFAVSRYYAAKGGTYGDSACVWDGAAYIVYAESHQITKRSSFPDHEKPLPKFVGDNDFLLFMSNIVCDDGATPWLNY